PFIFEEAVTIGAAAIADVEVSFRIADRIRLGLGANNLLDKLPTRLPDGHVAQLWSMDYPSESPYGIAGRVLYLRLDVAGS
ncbi:MAG: TonB-dependent receptor, partial [Gemmatimonadetes bacterium]|nr:TonB-dependent receptor [Gemmatimonadota bacterium]